MGAGLPDPAGLGPSPNCDVGHISPVWRSQAVGDGRLRTSTDAEPTARPCAGLNHAPTGYTMDAGADITLPKVPGYKPRGTGKITNALPAWGRASGLICGIHPANSPYRLNQAA